MFSTQNESDAIFVEWCVLRYNTVGYSITMDDKALQGLSPLARREDQARV